jgi:hypothetical protein
VCAALIGNEQASDLASTCAVTKTAPASASTCTRAAMLATSP